VGARVEGDALVRRQRLVGVHVHAVEAAERRHRADLHPREQPLELLLAREVHGVGVGASAQAVQIELVRAAQHRHCRVSRSGAAARAGR